MQVGKTVTADANAKATSGADKTADGCLGMTIASVPQFGFPRGLTKIDYSATAYGENLTIDLYFTSRRFPKDIFDTKIGNCLIDIGRGGERLKPYAIGFYMEDKDTSAYAHLTGATPSESNFDVRRAIEQMAIFGKGKAGYEVRMRKLIWQCANALLVDLGLHATDGKKHPRNTIQTLAAICKTAEDAQLPQMLRQASP